MLQILTQSLPKDVQPKCSSIKWFLRMVTANLVSNPDPHASPRKVGLGTIEHYARPYNAISLDDDYTRYNNDLAQQRCTWDCCVPGLLPLRYHEVNRRGAWSIVNISSKNAASACPSKQWSQSVLAAACSWYESTRSIRSEQRQVLPWIRM